MDRLPGDVLCGVLNRLPPRSLAACRCICKGWRAAVDARGLLLPRSLYGIFINYNEHPHSNLFRRRHPGSPPVDGALGFMPNKRWRTLVDHCNGLFIYEDYHEYYVCNPATRRWMHLPPRMEKLDYAAAHLVFDPAASLDYEVVLLRGAPSSRRSRKAREEVANLVEWPPAVYETDVFSSATGRWERRLFVRQGDAVGTFADVLSEGVLPAGDFFRGPRHRYAEYLNGALYVHLRGFFLIRLSLSDNTYRATKTPTYIEVDQNKDTSIMLNNEDIENNALEAYLGRSEKGIYYLALHKLQIHVWSLDESHGQMEWVFQHHSDITPLYHTLDSDNVLFNNALWTLEDYNSHDDDFDDHAEYFYGNTSNVTHDDGEEEGEEELGEEYEEYDDNYIQNLSDITDDDGEEEDFEWNSDGDYTLQTKKITEDVDLHGNYYFLGFHPYKEVIFLAWKYIVVAYNLGQCKAEYLGYCSPRGFGTCQGEAVLESFPYTPCFVDALPKYRKMHV